MDTKPMEKEALDLIKSLVSKYGYKYAEINFDEKGGDFFIFKEINNYEYKVLRCQSKGRSVYPKGSSVKIPIPYVLDNFLVFVYIKPKDVDKSNVYLFLADEIKSSWSVRNNNYCFNFGKKNINNGYINEYLFNKDKAPVIESLLSKVGKEYDSHRVNALSDSDFYYKMWQKTGGLPSLEYLREINDDDIFTNIIGTNKFVFLLCALIIQNREECDLSLSVDWAFTYLKEQEVCRSVREGYKEGKTYNSDVAITYPRTWVNELVDNLGGLAGYHLHIGDNEECVDAYVWRKTD